MFALTLLPSLLAALAVTAAPTKYDALDLVARAGGYPAIPGDKGSCAKIGQLCAATLQDPATANNGPFGKSKECAINTMCTTLYSPTYTVDLWIDIYFAPPNPDSITAPRLSQDVYNTLLAPGAMVATEQSFIDAYYSTLSTVNGPFPDVSYVQNVWSSIAHWTGFCSTKEIPYSNLADWFQYSATNPFPGTCEAPITATSSSTASSTPVPSSS